MRIKNKWKLLEMVCSKWIKNQSDEKGNCDASFSIETDRFDIEIQFK